MSTVINTNLASLFAQNSLTNAQNNLATSVQRLSSGLRINSAKDDAAGLAIAQNMQGQINGTNQSIQNLNDATNLLQTADSSLSTVQDMLLRLKQLAVQGYDGSLSVTQKKDIVQQMVELNSEINATAQRTAFNGINLLSSGSSIDQVNSDIKVGSTLSNKAVSIDTTSGNLGYYALGGGAGSGNGAGNANLGDSASTGSGVNSTFGLNIDPSLAKYTPGTYTLAANGNKLTLTGTFRGQAQSQTVTVADAVGNSTGGANKTVNQQLDFSNFGISIDLNSTISAGTTETGSTLASAFVARSNSVHVLGQGGEVSDVRLSGAAPGTYTLTYGQTGAIATGTSSIALPANLNIGQAALLAGNGGLGGSGTIAGLTLTNAAGSTATGTLSYDASGNVTGLNVTAGGTGFVAGDQLTISSGTIGAAPTAIGITSVNQGAVATPKISSVTFAVPAGGAAAGDTYTVAGLTFTASAVTTAADIASAFATGSSSKGTFSGSLSGYSISSTATPGVINLTSTATGSGAIAPVATSNNGTATVAAISGGANATYAKDQITFSALTAGQSVTIGDGVFVAGSSGAAAADIATAFKNNVVGNTVGGTLTHAVTGYAASAGAGTSQVLFTANTAGANNLTSTTAHDDAAKSASFTGATVTTLAANSTSNLLTMTGLINGVTTTQAINLQNDVNGLWNSANNTKTINFSSFGIALDVSSFQDQSANDVGQQLATINSGSPNGQYGNNGVLIPGQIIVGQGANSHLEFQSGPTSEAFVGINTLNVQTGTTGTYAGTSGAMMTVGTAITGIGAGGSTATNTIGYLSQANSTDLAAWGTAFKNAAAAVDSAVDYISTQRSTYGSQMNRISYISSNLTAQSTNLQNSRSAITDTNFAAETATLTKGQIMQQAATAMLAQANQMPNVILSLLK